MERKAQEASHRRRARVRRNALVGSVAAVVAALATWQLWAAFRPGATSAPADSAGRPRPEVIEFPIQGAEHVAPGASHPAYNSNPPTSGWHYATPAPWGFYNDEMLDEILVHNLEHGGIWISFKNADDRDVVDRLAALTRRHRSKVIVTLRTKNDARIVVAAWGRLMKLEAYDRAAIEDFIARYKNKGPERVPD
jgi:uncharacterized protein DUF3105